MSQLRAESRFSWFERFTYGSALSWIADTCAPFLCARDVLTTTLACCAYTASARAEGHGPSRLAEKEVRVRACDAMLSVGALER